MSRRREADCRAVLSSLLNKMEAVLSVEVQRCMAGLEENLSGNQILCLLIPLAAGCVS